MHDPEFTVPVESRLRLWRLAFAAPSLLTVSPRPFALLKFSVQKSDSLFRALVMRLSHYAYEQGVELDLCESQAARVCWFALYGAEE